jgi:folate-dependent phosphoribosylglycinamide formyltransferase PurN
MHLVLLTTPNSFYSASILGFARRCGIRFDACVIARRNWIEQLRLIRLVCKRGGWRGLPYYLNEKRIESRYLKRIASERLNVKSMRSQLPPLTIQTHGVNSEETLSVIRSLAPDLLVLGQIGIVGPRLLEVPRMGTLNAHTAILPCFRGYADPAHMVLADRLDAIGATVHWTVPLVDSGAILRSAQYIGEKPPSLSALLSEVRFLAARLLVEQIAEIQKSQEFLRGQKQNLLQGHTYSLLPVGERHRAEAIYAAYSPDCFAATREPSGFNNVKFRRR